MTLIKTPFGFRSTAAEVAACIDLTGKRAIVTGASSGIGIETARALAGAGAQITLAVRNTQAGSTAAADIAATTGRKDIVVAALEVTEPASVAAFVAVWEGPLDILVNNAGVMMSPEQRTPEGWELQFATNHLGHFALACALHEALAAVGSARIVVVSSTGHLYSPVVFDDLHFRVRPYDPLLAYAQSKTAAILFAVGATARWVADGITANALNPGAIATNLQRHVGGKLVTPPERQKTPSRALPPRSCSRRLRISRASAAATSTTATKPRPLTTATRPERASPPTPSTPSTRIDSGTSRKLSCTTHDLSRVGSRAQKAFATDFHSSRRRAMSSARSSALPASSCSRSEGSARR